jgi:deoxyadenosine/deoxycytidine kinase
MQQPLIVTLDGNIGSGKSTLLAALAVQLPDVEVVVEPVAEWMILKNGAGKSLLELFYEDKRRWSYTFQNCAILTRLRTIKEAMASTKKRVILTERSVLTDRYVFAEMLRASGDIDELEWSLYCQWFDTFAASLPVAGIVYLTTGVTTSGDRITKRGRAGEGHIPASYLAALEAQHKTWLSSTALPVLELSTEEGESVDGNIAKTADFIARLTSNS